MVLWYLSFKVNNVSVVLRYPDNATSLLQLLKCPPDKARPVAVVPWGEAPG